MITEPQTTILWDEKKNCYKHVTFFNDRGIDRMHVINIWQDRIEGVIKTVR